MLHKMADTDLKYDLDTWRLITVLVAFGDFVLLLLKDADWTQILT